MTIDGSASVLVLSALILLLLISNTLSATAQRFSFQSFTQRDGLHNLDLNCLLQDKKGSLWACTEFGLYRYDGSRFELVNTVEGEFSPLIQGIAEDAEGRIWASTPQSLLYLDGSGIHRVSSATEDLSIDLRTPLALSAQQPNHVYFIGHHQLMAAQSSDEGKTWQIRPAFTGEALSRLPILGKIRSAYADPSGHLWLGCGEHICESDQGTVRVLGSTDGVPTDQWLALVMDRNGDLWARGNHHVVHLKAHASHFQTEERDLPLSGLEMRAPCLIEDPQGRILTNTANGLARWDKGSWIQFTKQNGLPTGQIQAMIFDRQGSLWLDGGKAGLQRWIGYDSWENWTVDDGLSSNLVWSILRGSDRDLWIGTELGLERFEAGQAMGHTQPAPGSLHVRRVQSVVETRDKHLWIGTDDGAVVEYDPAKGAWKVVSQQVNVYQVFLDREDRVWVLAASGLFQVERHGEHTTLRPPPGAGLPKSRFYRAVQDTAGNILFTSDQGLYILQKETWTKIRLPATFHATYNTQIALGKEGTFWLGGTSPSLMQLRLTGDSATEISRVSYPALLSANVYLLASDQRGWLWVGSDSGVDIFDGSEWRQVVESDGLIWNDIDTGAFLSDDDGSVWIGTSGGLSHVMHPERLFLKAPLDVTLSQTKLGNINLDLSKRNVIPWGHYPLTFHMESLDFARSQAIRYQYQLSGVDDVPQQTTDHDIRYSFVPEGHHRLVVTAVDPGTHRVSNSQVVEFTIHPPWWRTPLFFALVSVATLLLAISLWRWSNRYTIARRYELEKLVQERTRELEQKNTSLLDARAALLHQATHDSLTGVLNRGAIYSVLEREIDRGHRENESLVVVMADVDHFKQVNDLHGHQFGDYVLQEIAQRLGSAIRTYDSLGRYGGEEFLVVFPKLSFEESIARVHGLREMIEKHPVTGNGNSLRVTCSFGVAVLERGSDLQTLVSAADQALYAAKANGRNRVEFAKDLSRRAKEPVRDLPITA